MPGPMDANRFIKLLLMTTSPHDGECLNAIRMANAMLAGMNANWDELIRGLIPSVPEAKTYSPPQQPSSPPPSSDNKHYADEVDEVFDLLYAGTHSDSYMRFIDSVFSFYHKTGFLTDNQFKALKRGLGR